MYAGESLGFDRDNTVYDFDSTTIDPCLSVFPWARFRSRKAAVKMHTWLDLGGSNPTFVEVSERRLLDVTMLDAIVPEPGSFYVMDRAYLGSERLHLIPWSGAFFVTRGEEGKATPPALLSSSRQRQRTPFRRIRHSDEEESCYFLFLANNFDFPALTICLLYNARWRVELYFGWIQQQLRIKAFYGHSQNAVMTQIRIAVSVYVLVAIVKKRLALGAGSHEIQQLLPRTLIEQVPLFAGVRHSTLRSGSRLRETP